MRLSILAKIIDMLSPRYCPVCGNRLNGEEESICVSCNLFLPRTDTWKDPYNNEMAKMFFNGGGHLNASGGRLMCSIVQAEKVVRNAISYYGKLLKDNKNHHD